MGVCVLNAATASFDTFTYVLSLSSALIQVLLELNMFKEQERCVYSNACFAFAL
jgi:hypothetical protein